MRTRLVALTIGFGLLVMVPATYRSPVPPAPRLVTLGDSITAASNPCGAGWPTFLSKPPFHNAGVGGNTTGAMLHRLTTDVLAYRPTDVTILGGTNDIYNGVPLSTSMSNLAAIIDAVHGIGATPWLLTLPPFPGHEDTVAAYNAALAPLALAHGARLINIYPALAADWAGYSCDGVHPTGSGAAVIARLVQSFVQ